MRTICVVSDQWIVRFLHVVIHVVLQIARLCHCTNLVKFWEEIEQFPTDIGLFYAITVERIRAQHQEHTALAILVLIWLLYVKRPLSVKELQHAMAMNMETQQVESAAIVHEDILFSVCCGLVTIDKESRQVHLICESI